jgi:hypothetical protein
MVARGLLNLNARVEKQTTDIYEESIPYPLLGSVVVRVAVPVKSQVAPAPLFLWK